MSSESFLSQVTIYLTKRQNILNPTFRLCPADRRWLGQVVVGYGARPLHPHPPRHHDDGDPGAGHKDCEEPADDHRWGRHLHHFGVSNSQFLHSTGSNEALINGDTLE